MRDRSVPSNLQANWIWGLHRDRGGEMWVASTTGLSRTRPQQDAILSLFSSDGSSWTDPYVFAVDADARGVVTLGQKSGIEIIDPAAAEDERGAGRQRRRAAARRAMNNVTAMVHADDGTRWLGSLDGLFTVAPGSRQIRAGADARARLGQGRDGADAGGLDAVDRRQGRRHLADGPGVARARADAAGAHQRADRPGSDGHRARPRRRASGSRPTTA